MNPTSPCIQSLFSSCRPSDISRFVVSVVVGVSVHRMVWCWSLSKFTIELLERFKLKLNTSATIVFESWMVRVSASCSCSDVSLEFWRWPIRFRQSGLAVCDKPRCRQFTSETATGTRRACFQATAAYFFNNSARALAIPKMSVYIPTSISHYCPSTVFIVCKIDKFAAGWKRLKFNGIFVVGHGIFSVVEKSVIRLGQSVSALSRAVLILPQTTHKCGTYV